MPYFRIVIWTKRRRIPFTGIRIISDPNINSVYTKTYSKANELYRHDLIDVEVQMLSKLCKAVQQYEQQNKI